MHGCIFITNLFPHSQTYSHPRSRNICSMAPHRHIICIFTRLLKVIFYTWIADSSIYSCVRDSDIVSEITSTDYFVHPYVRYNFPHLFGGVVWSETSLWALMSVCRSFIISCVTSHAPIETLVFLRVKATHLPACVFLTLLLF